MAITHKERTGLQTGGRRTYDGLAILCSPRLKNHTRVIKSTDYFIHIKVQELHIINVYISPSTNDQVLLETLDYLDNLEGRAILFGDLNARLGPLTMDTTANRRGNAMINAMSDSCWILETPDNPHVGTCYGNTGRGTPDHLLSVNALVTEYKIVEKRAMLSDHLPLVARIADTTPVDEIQFSRWNIKALADPSKRAAYQTECSISAGTLTGKLIEQQWTAIKDAINHASEMTIGKLNLGKKRSTNIMSAEARATLIDLETISEALQGLDARHQHWGRLHNARARLAQRYTAQIESARKKYFETLHGNLSLRQNRQALIKRVATRNRFSTRSTNSLDPASMTAHVNHFKKTFGLDPPVDAHIGPLNTSALPLITKEEVAQAMGLISLGKAGGVDGIFPEQLVYATNLYEALAALFNRCQTDKSTPDEWRQALIAPVYKKGDPTIAANYRPIALTCVCRRVYERVLMIKYLNQHEPLLADIQCGFRPNRNTQQQAFVLHEAMVATNTEVALLDMSAAYDTVPRSKLWSKLKDRGVPDAVLLLLQSLFDHNHSKLIIKNQHSSPIPNKRGLLQGSAMSPILFNFFVDDLLTELQTLPGTKVYGCKVSGLAFADDIALIANNAERLQRLVLCAETWAVSNGMKFNATKCEHLGTAPGPTLDGTIIGTKPTAKYLGFWFTKDGIDLETSAQKRIEGLKQRTFALRRAGFNIGGVTIESAKALYVIFIRPMIEYGLGFYHSKKLKPLQQAQEFALRTMLSANRYTSRAAMHLLTKIPPLLERCLILRTSLFGSLHNSNNATIPAVKIYWSGLQCNRPVSSLINVALSRDGCFRYMPKRNHVLTTLSRLNPSIDPEVATDDRVRAIARQNANATLKVEDGNIAMSLNEGLNCSPRAITYLVDLGWQAKIDTFRWLIGNVCWHKPLYRRDEY
jgi:hypothetical protein